MAQNSYQQLNLNGDIVLSWPFSFTAPPVVADINNVSTLQIQIPCYGATTGNLVSIYNNGSSGVGATLTNNGTLAAFTIDGLSPSLNARILVKNQTPLSNTNGIYTLTTIGDGSTEWVLTRAIDYDTPSEIQKGDFVLVTNGTVNANTKWIQTANIISVGISSPNFIMRNNGWTITLPDATLATPGQNVQFNNIGLFPFQILANDGITNIANVSSGDIYYLYLNDNSTLNGSWNPIQLTDGSSSINSVVVKSTGNTIAVTNGTLTPPGGTINLDLTTSLTNLNNLSTTGGFLVETGSSPLTWATRNLVGGGNIIITNGTGVAGNAIIDINSSGITGIASAGIGNLVLSTNNITSSLANGTINILSTGTGKAIINNTVNIDTSGNITGANNLTLNGSLTVTGGFTNPRTPKAFFTFTDTLVFPSNVIAIQDASNIASITGSAGTYIITFTTPMSSTNYGVVFGLGSTGGTPSVSHVFWTLKTTTAVTIAIVNASGVLVTAVPNGITGTIMLST